MKTIRVLGGRTFLFVALLGCLVACTLLHIRQCDLAHKLSKLEARQDLLETRIRVLDKIVLETTSPASTFDEAHRRVERIVTVPEGD